ncbi:hypothetical protein ACTHOQ_02175 [Solibacillus silvestris]|uniref:hypothetical protein n=1 Tax=Solibacillus silvestris TaxID=76853 RepID=UPI003F8230E9
MIYYLIYIVISAIVLLILNKGDWKASYFKICVVSFIPIIGWLLPSIWPRKWLKKDAHFFAQYLTEQSGDIHIELLKSESKIERDEELNVVSIEEALLVNDYATRRKILIDVLKEDAMKFIDVLKTAVTNDDTETSHYAVTAVVEVKRELTNLMQKLAVEYSKNPQNTEIAQAYGDIIKEYLRSGFLDAQSTKKYQVTYIEILQKIIENDAAAEDAFIEKIHMELAIQDTIAAEQTAMAFKERFPNSEQAYLTAMKIFFETFAADKLQQELQLLKASPITLSNEALNYVRYWSGVFESHEGLSE